MGRFVDGVWTTRPPARDADGRFVRRPTTLRRWIRADGSTPFTVQADRYHLYAAFACPWAHRTLNARRLYGLEDAISVTILDPHMTGDGWHFSDAPGCQPDPLMGATHLRDVYVAGDAHYTGRVSVPVLWDRHTGTIVNNESREIVRMMSRELRALHTTDVDLAPDDLVDAIDAAIDAIYQPINNGVYRCGFARTQDAYDEAVTELFDALDHWDEVLGRQRFMLGERMTEADLCLYSTLCRFDLAYYTHFKCNVRHVWEYPNLWRHTRELYAIPAIGGSVDLDHVKVHYYWSHESINPKRIIPRGPARWLATEQA